MKKRTIPRHYANPGPDTPTKVQFWYYLAWVNRREW